MPSSRDRFIESFLQVSMSDTRYYNAVYNLGKCSLERVTRSILELVPVGLVAAAVRSTRP